MSRPAHAIRPRDRSRPWDIVLYGASGFTGRLTAEVMAGFEPDVRWAIAGRNRPKLEQVRAELDLPPGVSRPEVLIADSTDRGALDLIARDASVVCTTVGPYAKYGTELVAACVEHGTDYCDLTGETQFIRRMVDQWHDRAVETGARIVHCCGFDSIPSDLGLLALQRALVDATGEPADHVVYALKSARGGASGGTIASMLNVLEEARDPAVRRILGHPYALNPEGDRRGPDGSDLMTARYDRDLKQWTAPFVMAAINTRVVRRSHSLMGRPWGEDFRYREVSAMGTGAKGATRAYSMAAGLGAFIGATAVKPLRALLEKTVLPSPGEGPDQAAREKGRFAVDLVGFRGGAEVGRAKVRGSMDPGYGATSFMLAESARCLALDGATLTSPGGVLTPAVAMGARLTQRLNDVGVVTFEAQVG